MFDFYFSLTKPEGEFVNFNSHVEEFNFNKNMSYFDMVVQTKDTVCYSWFIQRFIDILDPVYITGITGTGKTVVINSTLKHLVANGKIAHLSITFSAQTPAMATQLQIESKLQSNRKNKKVVLLPPPGRKFVLFVDDINMPQVEEYGAQPPIELLRQFQDQKGFYDRKLLVTFPQ
jgi:dynein heavy chain